MISAARPFARHGTEKMVYDLRMGPQALWHEDSIFIVYHSTGGEDAELRGHPDQQRRPAAAAAAEHDGDARGLRFERREHEAFECRSFVDHVWSTVMTTTPSVTDTGYTVSPR